MKNKILAILLCVACVCVSYLPSTLTNYTHYETETFSIDQSAEQPTFNILYKDNSEAMKAYQETYNRVYQETLDNIRNQQNDFSNQQIVTQQNITDFYNQLIGSDWGKILQSNNDNVVKSIKGDGKGNVIVSYTNGTKETISVYSSQTQNITPTIYNYEQVGYILINNSPNTLQGSITGVMNFVGCDYTISNYKIELVEINNSNPSLKYKYKVSYNYYYTNLNRANASADYLDVRLNIKLDNFFSSVPSKVCHTDDMSADLSGEFCDYFYSSVPYVEITQFSTY